MYTRVGWNILANERKNGKSFSEGGEGFVNGLDEREKGGNDQMVEINK